MPPFKHLIAALALVVLTVLISAPVASAANVGVAASGDGCLMAKGSGRVNARGTRFQGDASPHVDRGIVAVAANATGPGYYLAAADGAVYAFGGAPYKGSARKHVSPEGRIVGMATSPTGGYFLVSDAGAVYAFGRAVHRGSARKYVDGGVVGIAAAERGGYYVATRRGAVYNFGKAPYRGSAASKDHRGIVGIATSGQGGYYLAAADGALFRFGRAPFSGGAKRHVDGGIVGIAVNHRTGAYHLAHADSPGFAFGPRPPVCKPPQPPRPSAEGHVWPIRGLITGYFGWDHGRDHKGLDIDGETGDPVRATKRGWVVSVGADGGYGNKVLMAHDGGVTTTYAHLSGYNTAAGRRVDRGSVIGYVGSTGHSTGSHLHFEVRTGGTPRNPLDYLP